MNCGDNNTFTGSAQKEPVDVACGNVAAINAGGCCKKNLRYCGGEILLSQCPQLRGKVKQEYLYKCEVGKNPVFVEACASCQVMETDRNDICHAKKEGEGCYGKDLDYCGAQPLLNFCAQYKDQLNAGHLYRCEKGKHPVLIDQCKGVCNVEPTDKTDFCAP